MFITFHLIGIWHVFNKYYSKATSNHCKWRCHHHFQWIMTWVNHDMSAWQHISLYMCMKFEVWTEQHVISSSTLSTLASIPLVLTIYHIKSISATFTCILDCHDGHIEALCVVYWHLKRIKVPVSKCQPCTSTWTSLGLRYFIMGGQCPKSSWLDHESRGIQYPIIW